MRIIVVLLVLPAALCAQLARARDVHEDFVSALLGNNWYVCNRFENAFVPDKAGPGSMASLRLDVRARHPVTAFMNALPHPECNLEDDPSEKYERAEIWEKDCDFEPLGTEIWQSFALRVDPDAAPVSERLVIGQWKEGWRVAAPDCRSPMRPGMLGATMAQNTRIKLGGSPFLAQRFERQMFSITLEQQNASLDRPGLEDQCRVMLAVDAHRKPDELLVRAHAAEPTKEVNYTVPMHGVSDAAGLEPDADALAKTCLRGLKIERFAPLPNPFGQWVYMRYHLKVTASSAGMVEVWADGNLIARATGAIGTPPPQVSAGPDGKVPDLPRAMQYFKFGPYRNLEGFKLSTWIADYHKVHRAIDLPPLPPLPKP